MTGTKGSMMKTIGKALVIVVLVAVLGGLVALLAYGDEIKALVAGEPQAAPPATAQVTKGSIAQTVTGAGEAKAVSTEKLKPADSWHWLDSFDAPLNKRVAAGDVLVTYANGETWNAPFDLVVTSYTLPEKNKGAVTKDDHFIEVQRIDEMALTMQVPEADLASVAEGQAVAVTLGSDESRIYEGAIANINEVGTYGATGSKFTVTVTVPNDGSIKIGMSANLSITVAEATDVLLVPVSAVGGEGDAKYVEVYDAASGETKQVPVTSGITDGTLAEVSGALDEGDAVVVHEASAGSGDAAFGSEALAAV